MKSILAVLVICLGLSTVLQGQREEISQATGLPIPVGSPVIFGQVIVRNLPRNETRPSVVVILRQGGIQVERFRVGDSGYWYFLRRPEQGMMLAFEVDGTEVGPATIVGSNTSRFRQDMEINWNALRGPNAKSAVGTTSVRDRYPRDRAQEKAFEEALAVSQSADPSAALKLFDAILQKDPKDYNAWVVAGMLRYVKKEYAEARRAFTKAIELNPKYFFANLNLGKLEMDQKKYEPAIVALLKAVEVDGTSADANFLLGEAYLQMKKGSLAVGYLKKSLELDPIEKADAHLRLAALFNAAGYKHLASAEYATFLEKVKDHPSRKELEQYIKDNPPGK